jgi:hypothetical protein
VIDAGAVRSTTHRWGARALALLGLLVAVVAVLLVVTSVHTNHDVTEAQATSAMFQLAGADQELSSRLHALTVGQSPQAAQSATHRALSVTAQLSSALGTGGDLGAAVHAVLRAELAYLDAVGSSLNNPRSVLLGQVVARAGAVRAALQAIPGAVPASVSGATALVAYSQARNGG